MEREAAAETGHESIRRSAAPTSCCAASISLNRAANISASANCLVRILGETTPCEQMEEAQPGLRNALRPDWRAGVFGEIVEGGPIRIGDAAELL